MDSGSAGPKTESLPAQECRGLDSVAAATLIFVLFPSCLKSKRLWPPDSGNWSAHGWPERAPASWARALSGVFLAVNFL